ncbi:MAG: type I methionyl aminopeptidase [Deltaproteobacteria bacterium RBG_19FT_COMBO_52_11]|nr:MAG: type I methionyl aminopeptidase [Deltaproteobacteria bacterium RBG_19FT_COMBO_52_11]
MSRLAPLQEEERIVLKSPQEIEKMRRSNQIVAEILDEVGTAARPGVTTRELDELAAALLFRTKARSAFKGYNGYPATLCTSVNEEVVHGIPSLRVLREGDILSLDFGAITDDFYGDAAITLPIGHISEEAGRLLRVAEEALYLAIDQARPDNRLQDISAAIQRHVETNGFSVVRDFVGHGIGRQLHEKPQIPNFGVAGRGIRLQPGMILAIEPMINAGGYEVEILPDGWTAVTKDRSLSAHFEHSVAVTENGPHILSKL